MNTFHLVCLQVCCHDVNCFDLASLHRPSDRQSLNSSAAFTLVRTVAVTAISCSAPPLPASGTHDCEGETFSLGHLCTYRCSRGHNLVGSSTTQCQGGSWLTEPPVCRLLSYVVSSSTIEIGETTATGIPASRMIDITIADPLSEPVTVPVSAQGLSVGITPARGVSFAAESSNQTHAFTVTSPGDNQLLERSVTGQLRLEAATASSHYSGFPQQQTVITTTLVDSEPFAAEFFLSAFHATAPDVFNDTAREIGERSVLHCTIQMPQGVV